MADDGSVVFTTEGMRSIVMDATKTRFTYSFLDGMADDEFELHSAASAADDDDFTPDPHEDAEVSGHLPLLLFCFCAFCPPARLPARLILSRLSLLFPAFYVCSQTIYHQH